MKPALLSFRTASTTAGEIVRRETVSKNALAGVAKAVGDAWIRLKKLLVLISLVTYGISKNASKSSSGGVGAS